WAWARLALDDQTITQFIDADFNNPIDQFLVSKLRGRFSSKGLRMLLLDWITYHNLPFEIVNTERFQRSLLYGNPLLDKAYSLCEDTAAHARDGCSIPNLFLLYGWTSKSYTSFLGIDAQFIDCDFVQHRILLGLRPLYGRHNGASWEIEGACVTTKPAVLQYRLSAYDWKVIKILIKLLKPFEVATNQLQGSGVPGTKSTCGNFDEYFPVFEMLLDHLENAIEGTIFDEVEDPVTKEKDVDVAIYDGLDNRTRGLLKVFIKLGWKKLHKYYTLMTSAAYVGAVVFNPAKK
ncbi:hypothetical protein S40288_09729, partial [Stachybotrys chartarum IBT 40288]